MISHRVHQSWCGSNGSMHAKSKSNVNECSCCFATPQTTLRQARFTMSIYRKCSRKLQDRCTVNLSIVRKQLCRLFLGGICLCLALWKAFSTFHSARSLQNSSEQEDSPKERIQLARANHAAEYNRPCASYIELELKKFPVTDTDRQAQVF